MRKDDSAMNTVIQVEVPQELQELLAEVSGDAGVSRLALEALVLEAVRRGTISRRWGGEVLGLSFHESEQFYADRGINYEFTEAELRAEVEALDRMFGRK
jgi:hypothetical protein